MPHMRSEFTKDHDSYLFKYLACYCPKKEGRSGNNIFKHLVANEDGKWPWAAHHSWQSWRERYVKNSDKFDQLISNYQKKRREVEEKIDKQKKRVDQPTAPEGLAPSAKRVRLEEEEEEEEEEPPRREKRTVAEQEKVNVSQPKPTTKSLPEAQKSRSSTRSEFTKLQDSYLVGYLAVYCPTKEGRSGNNIFKRLTDDQDEKWPWAVDHSWQSWRERYVRKSDEFDMRILIYQQKKREMGKRKRADEPGPSEMLAPSAKRPKRREEKEEEEEETPSREKRTPTKPEKANASKPKSVTKSPPKYPREPQETPSQTPSQPPDATQPTSTQHISPANSPPRSSANDSASPTRKAAPEPVALQTRGDDERLENQSSLSNQHPLFPEPRSPLRHVRRTKVRIGTPEDMFISEPSSPRMDAAEVPSSQAQPVPSAPVSTPVHPRAPPRVADSLHGKVLVNRQGHVPHAFPRDEENDVEEQEKEDEVQWPPARGRATKQKPASAPDVKTIAHHAFSQPEPPPERAETVDRRTVAALFSGQTPQRAASQVENERSDVVRDGASPVKRVVSTTPPSDPFAGRISKPLSKIFPAPRASTRSPFRPEPPVKEPSRSPPQPRPRSPSRIKAEHHPESTRLRRQTIANMEGRRIGRERPQQRDVPSVDLITHAHSSMSRSHSDSSAGMSIPARPPRWSLPAFAQATPWVFDEPWAVYGERWSGRARRASLGATSTPRFTWTPSPARSVANGTTSSTHAHANSLSTHPSSSTSLTPHPPDLQLTASHGLASILAHMSTNHGLALGVVEAVYKRVGSLREADEVLAGMREAAEGFGEREIEKRLRERRGEGNGREKQGVERDGRIELRYVIASEDGKGSEYSPPETSRAAMWKRQSESASHDEGTRVDEGEDEEAEEGREVEEELWGRDDAEDEEDQIHHDFSRHVPLAGEDDEMEDEDDVLEGDTWEEQGIMESLLENMKFAKGVERKLGSARYRKDIAKLFK